MTFHALGRAAAALLVLALTLSACTKPGSKILCRPEIDRALRQASVPASDVRSMLMFTQSPDKKIRSHGALDAWIRLRSCSGHVVVSLTQKCYVQQVYTLGNCSVAGLPRY